MRPVHRLARGAAARSGPWSANTICDGIAVKRPGDFTLPLVDRYVDDVVTVSDDEVAQAMVLLLERAKLVVEGAGAVGVAALMQGRVEIPAEGQVCAVPERRQRRRNAAVGVHPARRDGRRAAARRCRSWCPIARAPSSALLSYRGRVRRERRPTSSTCATGIDLHIGRDRRSSSSSRRAAARTARRSSCAIRAGGVLRSRRAATPRAVSSRPVP